MMMLDLHRYHHPQPPSQSFEETQILCGETPSTLDGWRRRRGRRLGLHVWQAYILPRVTAHEQRKR